MTTANFRGNLGKSPAQLESHRFVRLLETKVAD